jgi:hypothetical protein
VLEAGARARVVQAFRAFAADRPEEMGLAADAPEAEVLAHAGPPTLVLTRFVYTPRDEGYEVVIRFPVAWDEEHGLEIPVVEGHIPGAVS